MSLVIGASAHGSPGVSTGLHLVAAQWPERDAVPVLVEADASGGVFAARYELGLQPGLVTLVESLRKREAPPLLDHAQRLPSGIGCVPASPSAAAMRAQLRSAAPNLGAYLGRSRHPVLLDAGRVVPDSPAIPLLTEADLVLWFVRPTREELLILRSRLVDCPAHPTAVVLVGDTPYGPAEVGEAMAVDVVHDLPSDRRGADAVNLGGNNRLLRRSALTRSCRALAERLAGHVAHESSAESVGIEIGGAGAESGGTGAGAGAVASRPSAGDDPIEALA